MSKPPALPTSLPGGTLLPHLSARLRTETIDAVFENIGGFEAFSDWAERNKDEFYTKIWAKGAAKAVSHEVSPSEGLEAMLERLDRAEQAKMIEGSFTEVES